MPNRYISHAKPQKPLPVKAKYALIIYLIYTVILYCFMLIVGFDIKVTYYVSIPLIISSIAICSKRKFGRFIAAWIPVFIIAISLFFYLESIYREFFYIHNGYNYNTFFGDKLGSAVSAAQTIALIFLFYAIPTLPAVILLNHPQVVSAYRNFSNNFMSENDELIGAEELSN